MIEDATLWLPASLKAGLTSSRPLRAGVLRYRTPNTQHDRCLCTTVRREYCTVLWVPWKVDAKD